MNDFTQLPDLAAERLGGRVLEANDDFFAPKENLLKESKPVFIEGKFTTRGKWMDGWETRRRRTPGHDWCIIRLGLPGNIRGVVVDTSFFTGNYPERFSLEGCDLGDRSPYKNERMRWNSPKTPWVQIFPETPLQGDSHNLFPVTMDRRFTHLRLRIFPDGGVARLRVHGEAVPDFKRLALRELDLAAVENGGSPVAASDQHYGAPRNLLMPYRAKNMGDGWETKRRRGPGHDWVILKLGVPGTIHRVLVDTSHFKGNYPDSCSLEAFHANPHGANSTNLQTAAWNEVLSKTKLKPNRRHLFADLSPSGVATHVRFQIFPDGGVSRLRIFGKPELPGISQNPLDRFNRLPRQKAIQQFRDCCGSRAWAQQLAESRPFSSEAELHAKAEEIWSQLSEKDWLEAFRHHPRIGGARAGAKRSPIASRWSASEQSTAQQGSSESRARLALQNAAYAKKFGYVFLICAASKTTEEILAALERRMANDPKAELRLAAEEQRKIIRLRLEKLLTS